MFAMSTNPYQPPAQFSEPLYLADSRRPTAATAFGILHLLFGVTGVCCYGLLCVLILISLSSDLQLIEDSSQYRVLNRIGMLLGLVTSAVLIAAGVGLLRLRPYGRTLSIGYGIYAIVMNVFAALFNVVFIFPTILESANAPGGWAAGAGDGLLGSIVGFGMRLAYAGLLLYFMFRPNILVAFKNQGKGGMTKS
jgi:hypothetical protein